MNVDSDFTLEVINDSIETMKKAFSSSGWNKEIVAKKRKPIQTQKQVDLQKIMSLAGDKFRKI
ncbi:MAG: hypothetical protein WCR30_02670 [Clostridia bacterium]